MKSSKPCRPAALPNLLSFLRRRQDSYPVARLEGRRTNDALDLIKQAAFLEFALFTRITLSFATIFSIKALPGRLFGGAVCRSRPKRELLYQKGIKPKATRRIRERIRKFHTLADTGLC